MEDTPIVSSDKLPAEVRVPQKEATDLGYQVTNSTTSPAPMTNHGPQRWPQQEAQAMPGKRGTQRFLCAPPGGRSGDGYPKMQAKDGINDPG